MSHKGDFEKKLMLTSVNPHIMKKALFEGYCEAIEKDIDFIFSNKEGSNFQSYQEIIKLLRGRE